MARGFGTTLGSASTDKILSAITSHNSVRSHAIWSYLRVNTGDGERLFQKGSYITLLHSNTNEYFFQRQFSGALASWKMAMPAAGEWHHVGVAYDESNTTNDPVMYLDGVSQSVTEATPPSGTASTDASVYTIGNRSANDRVWDGMLAWVAIWNAILTADEWLALGKGVCPLVIRPTTLIEFLPWAGSTTHSWVAGATTVTGTAVQPDAFRHHYPARRRRIYVPAAAAAARPALIGGKLTNSLLLGGLVR